MNNIGPVIELKVKYMEHAILQHLDTHHIDIKEMVVEAVKNFDIKPAVERATENAITKSIERFFSFGDGATVLEEAVKEAMNKFTGK